jgi:hypothetical protein
VQNRYSLGEFSDTGTYIGPSTNTGYESIGNNALGEAVDNPLNLAIDQAGNIWVTNEFTTQVASTNQWGAITKFVGLATPVMTPLASGLASGKIAPEP